MKIFDKRPLASVLSIFMFGFVAFSQGEVWLRITVAAIAPLLLLFAAFNINLRKLFIGLCAAIALSMIFSYTYFDCLFYPDKEIEGTLEITGTVYSVELDNTGATVEFETDSISESSLFNHKIIMNVDYDEANRLSPGDEIKFRGKIQGLNNQYNSELRRYYTSRGISAICECSDSIEIISHGTPPLESTIATYREKLSRRAMMLSDNYSGKLISALILGEKEILDGKTTLDFKRIGITHMLALSGMHLAILSVGITKLLAFFGIGKRTSGIFNIVFTLFYMGLTGFPVSVVRAGIMLIIATLLFLIVGSRDSLTSLVIAIFLISVFNPTSIFDISLWLSAFATLGIIVFGEYQSQKFDRKKRVERKSRPLILEIILGLLNYIKLSLLTSVFAICSTMLISMLSFDEFSVLSAVSTILLTPFITVFMYIGTLTLIIGDLVPIGMILSPISTLIKTITSWLSSYPNIYISTEHWLLVAMSVIITVALCAFFVLKLNKKVRSIVLASIVILLTVTYACGIIINSSAKSNNAIYYINDSKTSTFVFKSDDKAAILHSATYNQFSNSYAFNAIDYANLSELDYYIVTHYGFGLISHFEELLKNYKIDVFVLPRPRNDDEKGILSRINRLVLEYGSTVEFFESKTPYTVGELKITLNHSTVYGDDSIRAAFTINDGDTSYTYLSSGMLLEDFSNFAYKITRNSDVIIFGSHGKSYKDTVNINESFENTKTFILCSDNLFFTQDSYTLYKDKGCKIFTHPHVINIME